MRRLDLGWVLPWTFVAGAWAGAWARGVQDRARTRIGYGDWPWWKRLPISVAEVRRLREGTPPDGHR